MKVRELTAGDLDWVGRARSAGRPHVEGATVTLVPAPPIYDPGGPILFVTDVRGSGAALDGAREEAARLGAPVVVDQPATDHGLGAVLRAAGFYRHCDFHTGTVAG